MSTDEKVKLMTEVIESQERLNRATKSVATFGSMFDQAASVGHYTEAEKYRDMLHTAIDNICDAKMAGFRAIIELEKLVK